MQAIVKYQRRSRTPELSTVSALPLQPPQQLHRDGASAKAACRLFILIHRPKERGMERATSPWGPKLRTCNPASLPSGKLCPEKLCFLRNPIYTLAFANSPCLLLGAEGSHPWIHSSSPGTLQQSLSWDFLSGVTLSSEEAKKQWREEVKK